MNKTICFDSAAPLVRRKPVCGTAGKLKLYDTQPSVAAMLMAIVAYELQIPLNEQRFLSVKEIKEQN